jgi:hypothetical protein
MTTLKKTVSMIIFVIFILIVYVLLFSRDVVTVIDADLLLDPVEVLDQSNNAYYVFPIIDELPVATDRTITDAFITASKLPGYQCPTVVNKYSATAQVCPLNDLRTVAYLVADRSKSSLLAGDIADAMESALAIVRVANQLAVSPGLLTEELVSMALYSIALDTLDQLVDELSPAQNYQVAKILQQYSPDSTTLMNAYRVEYMISKNMIGQVGAGSGPFGSGESLGPYRWQPNRTTNELADWYRLVLGIEPASNTEIQEELETIASISPLVVVQPNSIGKMLLAVILGSTSSITARHNQLEQRYSDLLTSFTPK